MKYFLDTNICVYYLKESNSDLCDKIDRMIDVQQLWLPSMVVAELFHGAEKSAKYKENLANLKKFLPFFEVVDFDEDAAREYAKIRNKLERQGKIIGSNDLIIAATVVANSGVLVTNNTREFMRVPNLSIEDWSS